jgi:hypothetical protein
VRRLGGGVDDDLRANLLHEVEDTGAVPDVELVVTELRQGLLQPLLVPARVPRRAEEDPALVVVDAVDSEPGRGEEHADLGADQSGRSRDENVWHEQYCELT